MLATRRRRDLVPTPGRYLLPMAVQGLVLDGCAAVQVDVTGRPDVLAWWRLARTNQGETTTTWADPERTGPAGALFLGVSARQPKRMRFVLGFNLTADRALLEAMARRGVLGVGIDPPDLNVDLWPTVLVGVPGAEGLRDVLAGGG